MAGKIKKYDGGGRVSEGTDTGTVRARESDIADEQMRKRLKEYNRYKVPQYRESEEQLGRKNKTDDPGYTLSPLIRVYNKGGTVKCPPGHRSWRR